MHSARIATLTLTALLLAAGSLSALGEGRVAGEVLDPDGKPLAGVQVTVSAPAFKYEAKAKSNKKGQFTIMLLDATRDYVIRLEKEGYATIEEPLDPEVGGVLRRSWTLPPAQQVAAEQAGISPEELEASNQAVTLYNEGAAAVNAGDVGTAIAKFEAALAVDPALVPAHKVVGALYLKEGRSEDALATAEKLLAVEPGNVAGLEMRYDAAEALGRQELVEQALDALVAAEKSPEVARRVYNRGVALLKSDQREEAMRRFEQAAEIDPGLAVVHSTLANIYLTHRDYEKALAAAERILDRDPQNPEALTIKMEAYRGLGDKAKADEVAQALGAADPGGAAQTFYRQGQALFNAGNTQEAVAALDKSIAADPGYAASHYLLGLAHANLGDSATAKRHLQRFLELAPDHEDATTAREMLKYLN